MLASQLWNALPREARLDPTLLSFQQPVTTALFKHAFHSPDEYFSVVVFMSFNKLFYDVYCIFIEFLDYVVSCFVVAERWDKNGNKCNTMKDSILGISLLRTGERLVRGRATVLALCK